MSATTLKMKQLNNVDIPTRTMARAYAAKFAAETILAEPSQYQAPENSALTRVLSTCAVRPKPHMYHLIRQEFWAIHQTLKEGGRL